jgi:cyclopropane fatty-acyl-phospholipid synthase-like methyltransferase
MEREGQHLLMRLIERYHRPGGTILEVGSGRGELLRRLAREYGGEAWGIDPFIPGRDRGGVTLAELPAEQVHSLERRFHLIYSIHALHHFSDVPLFLSRMRQVLAEEGTFIFVDWRAGTVTGVPESYYQPRELSDMIREAGYYILEQGDDGEHLWIAGSHPVGENGESTQRGSSRTRYS